MCVRVCIHVFACMCIYNTDICMNLHLQLGAINWKYANMHVQCSNIILSIYYDINCVIFFLSEI